MGDTLGHFLHKKSGSSLWYYRRRYPADVLQALGRPVFMQSLKTSVKREAEKLSRQVSVAFDAICDDARLKRDTAQALANVKQGDLAQTFQTNAEAVMANVPQLVRLAACRVIEEQQRNPRGWLEVVKNWQSFYEAMKTGAVPLDAQRPAIEAQAFLNGFELAIQGKPLPAESAVSAVASAGPCLPQGGGNEAWPALCTRALKAYRDKVGAPRHQLAASKLPQVTVQSTAEHHIQEGLRAWCLIRLEEVKPRTVKTQLDCMVSALRCVLPKLVTPALRELKGVMQPGTGDRQSMPVKAIRSALAALDQQPVKATIRKDFDGGASQFDDIAIESLAILGIRPRELIMAKPNALVSKTDVFGKVGLYFRITNSKNKASEREIPLSDGGREVVDLGRLRAMFAWQEKNQRVPHGAVTSLSTRFRRLTGSHTPYQMRHTWKDVAVNAGVDFELRERILGHKVRGVAAVYGSGIPLQQGLDALMAVRSAIYE